MRVSGRKLLMLAGLHRRAAESLAERTSSLGGRRGEIELPRGQSLFDLGRDLLHVRVGIPAILAHHKPVGVVTSRVGDGGLLPVFDSLPWPWLGSLVEPVGRLDADTSGLLLFAADGQLIHRLTHPRHGVERLYEAELEPDLDAAGRERILAGELTLRDGHIPRPTGLERLPEGRNRWRIGLSEGKYHEVRRMFAAAGSRVARLRRTTYAGITLAGLDRGAWRRLVDAEAEALYGRVSLSPADSVEAWIEPGATASPC